MRYLYVILIFIGTLSCTDKNDTIKIKREIAIESNPVNIDLTMVGSPSKLICKDSLLYILDYYHKTNISVIDLKNRKHFTHLGTKGRGPEEIQHATSLWFQGDSLGVYDCTMKKVMRYILDDNKFKLFESFSVKDLPNNIYQMVGLNDSLYICSGDIFPSRYLQYNSKTKQSVEFGGYPFVEELKLPEGAYSLTFQSEFLRLDDTHFVSAVASNPSIEFYEVGLNEFKKIKKNDYIIPRVKSEITESYSSVSKLSSNVMGFRCISKYKKYVFALYSGRTFDEYEEDAFYGNKIIVFNEKGSVIVALNLDRDISKMCVHGEEIIAVVDKPEFKLFSFQIPKFD